MTIYHFLFVSLGLLLAIAWDIYAIVERIVL
jgi:hypothetical protein